jgi:NAD(P)-dependent dehydrogenase (short-subunit alcohol dehydrogenase family)
MELKDRTAIVTGAGRGIGRALALEFARQGAKVVCCGRGEQHINETASAIESEGGSALAVVCDVTQRRQVDDMVTSALDRFGRVDVLFNNAGSFNAIGAIWEVDPEVWWKDVTTNLLGPMLCSRAVLPHMMDRNEGIIINMDGGGSGNPFAGGSGYACSKAALLRLTDSLAAELRRSLSSVLVFGMGPGFVRTDMTELQAVSPLGLKWMPGSKAAFDAHQDGPPENCAKATVQLIRAACPELSGRVFGVGTDFADVLSRAEDIAQKDLLTLRLRY